MELDGDYNHSFSHSYKGRDISEENVLRKIVEEAGKSSLEDMAIATT